MTDTVFITGIIAGLVIAALIIGAYGLVTMARHRKEPTDWDERTYDPPVSTKALIKERTFT